MWKVVKSWGFTILIAFILLSYLLFFETAEVSGNSMFPTYHDGDFLILRKTTEVDYSDVIAVRSEALNKDLIKRVIGVAGDHIVITSEGLYRNGELLDETYLTDDWSKQDLDIVVPEDGIFVLGDNRNASTDSRVLGCLKQSDVLGVSALDITKLTGLHRSTLAKFTLFCWIVCFLLMFCKKFRSKNKD